MNFMEQDQQPRKATRQDGTQGAESSLAARMADFQPVRLGRMEVPDIGWPPADEPGDVEDGSESA